MRDTLRYHRQNLIPGWKQSKLRGAHLAVVSCNRIGAAIAYGAAAIGIGSITIIDDGADFCDAAPIRSSFLFWRCVEAERARSLAKCVAQANTDVRVSFLPGPLVSPAQFHLISSQPDVIAFAGQNPAALEVTLEYAVKTGVPVVLALGTETQGLCAVLRDDRSLSILKSLSTEIEHLLQRPPGGAVACVMGGAALSEVRAVVMPLRPYDLPAEVIRYDAFGPERFPARLVPREGFEPASEPLQASVILAGAGAIGNWFCAAALAEPALSLRTLQIWDPDIVEPTNLNRQVFFACSSEAIGQAKCTVLAEQVRKLNPAVEVSSMPEPFGDQSISPRTDYPDLVVCAVDSFAARAEIQRVCGISELCLLNAGTSAMQADVTAYVPGVTACLRCTTDVERLAKQEPGTRVSCSASPMPSTVIPNMIAGGLLAAEAVAILANPEAYCHKGVIMFDTFSASRFGVRSRREPCNCWSKW